MRSCMHIILHTYQQKMHWQWIINIEKRSTYFGHNYNDITIKRTCNLESYPITKYIEDTFESHNIQCYYIFHC